MPKNGPKKAIQKTTTRKARPSRGARVSSKSRQTSDAMSGAVGIAVKNINRTSTPEIFQRGKHTVVRHREYVQDIVTDPLNVFSYDVFVLNPSNSTTFPWLSGLCKGRWESFRFLALRPEIRTMVGTSTSGQITLAIDYDSKDDTSAATKTQLLNTGNSVDCPMWGNMIHVSSEADLQRIGPYRFVDDEATLENSTDRLSSAGNLFVATSASSAGSNVNVAELWMAYEVEFLTPVLAVSALRLAQQEWVLAMNNTTGTDAFNFLSGVATVGDVWGETPGLAFIRTGLNGAIQGPPSIASTAWQYASGSIVPNGINLLVAMTDFAGSISMNMFDDVAAGNTIPNLSFGILAPVVSTTAGGNPTSGYFGGISTLTDIAHRVTNPTADLGMGQFVFDCILPAGSGLSLTVPSYTPASTTDAIIHAYPTSSTLAAFRRRMAAKAAKRDQRLAATSSTSTCPATTPSSVVEPVARPAVTQLNGLSESDFRELVALRRKRLGAGE